MSVEWKESALRDLKSLHKTFQKAVVQKLERAEQSPQYYLERLVDRPYYKLRVGDYRVFLDWQKPNRLAVLRIFHRKVAYKGR
ncbi:MAG: type II toxin-antitoxin system RelE/ParE family toxin [Candidatus Micrarchaeota archaeon]